MERSVPVGGGSHCHSQSLAFRSAIFEPKLNIFGFKSGELLPVGHSVELFCVLEDEVVTWVRVEIEPLLESGHFRHWVNESPVPFATFFWH